MDERTHTNRGTHTEQQQQQQQLSAASSTPASHNSNNNKQANRVSLLGRFVETLISISRIFFVASVFRNSIYVYFMYVVVAVVLLVVVAATLRLPHRRRQRAPHMPHMDVGSDVAVSVAGSPFYSCCCCCGWRCLPAAAAFCLCLLHGVSQPWKIASSGKSIFLL